MRRRPIVAIDGPSGSGKSTVGKRVAAALGFVYLDTGAMYRAVALRVLSEPDPEGALSRAGELTRGARIETSWDPSALAFTIRLDGRDVSADVRGAEAARWASRVAAEADVRQALVELQRAMAADGGVVMEGRDIGTVVFPDAEHKFFLAAPAEVRGSRRQAEEGGDAGLVAKEMAERDRNDSTRLHAPLRPAADAEIVETGETDVDGVVARLLAAIRKPSKAI